MSASIETLRPNIRKQIHVNSNYLHKYSTFRDRFKVLNRRPNCFLRTSTSSSSSFRQVNLYRTARVSRGQQLGLNSWGGFLKNHQSCGKGRIRANGSCEHDTDSTGEKTEANGSESKEGPTGSDSNSGSGRREKQGRGGWWSWWKGGTKWRWQPIVQAQEMGVLLLQLGIVIFVMRLLRPGIPLPGSEPRVPTSLSL